jgi:retron-type reverse transcriptase
VRDIDVLLAAWHAIERNGETSRSPRTREDTKRFAADLPKRINAIQRRLRTGSYRFSPQIGATPAKASGKGKRPLVIAPIEDRIVQRAILDVLQEAPSLPGVIEVLSTPTSVGGIRGRGVEDALALIDAAYHRGDAVFVGGSDISGFFTQVRQADVVDFVREQTDDDDFIDLLARAMRVELANADKLNSEDLHLFPTDEIGVAQGCPLSAFAGNVALRRFDQQMNGRGILCIRYVDDFMLSGRKSSSVEKAFETSEALLQQLNMKIYRPEDGTGKAFFGPIGAGFDFLGYRNVDHFLASLREEFDAGRAHIMQAQSRDVFGISLQYFSQTLVAADKRARAWIGSFRASRCADTAARVDKAIDQMVSDFIAFYRDRTSGLGQTAKRKLRGVHSISDEIRRRRVEDRSRQAAA